MPKIRLALAVCLALVLALLVAACGGGGNSSSGSSSTAEEPSSSEPAAEEGSNGEEGGPSEESIAFGLKWIGGKEEEADSSLPPVEIGFVNQEGSVPSYAEQRKAMEPAVEFVNTKLGGIEGHPIKMTTCIVQGEAEGQKCGAQFLNEGLQVIQYGLIVEGENAFFKTIGGKVPVLIDVATAAASLEAENAYTYTAGGPAVVSGMAYGAERHGYKAVSLISSANPVGKFAAEEVLGPALEKGGSTVTTTFVDDGASQPEFTSALQAAGASSADAVLQLPPGGTQCNYLLQGLKQLGLEKPVINTYTCYAPEVLEAFGGSGPEGVEIWGYTENPHLETEQSKVFQNVMTAYGQEAAAFQGVSSMSFSDVLTLAKLGNEIGFDKLSAKTWAEAIKGYEGEAFMVPGKMQCGKNPIFPTPCGPVTVGSEFKNGKWENVAEFNTLTGKGS
jgi:branched-chain amino acid transport system substrate-binding protein